MRRPVVTLLVIVAITAFGCSSDDSSAETSFVNTILPDETLPAPGGCDEAEEQLEAPSLEIDGETIEATLGEASWLCGNLTGEGFVTFTYNPILLDTSTEVEVVLDGTAVVDITWPGGAPFTEAGRGRWRSTEPRKGCSRLVIELESPSGLSTAVYGADIRVGGESCAPQRDLDPSDPDITNETPPDLSPDDTADSVPDETDGDTDSTDDTDETDATDETVPDNESSSPTVSTAG